MAKYDSIITVIEKVRDEVLKRQEAYLTKKINGEPIEDDEMKELNSLKKELKFIEKTYAEATGIKGGKIEPSNKLSSDRLQQLKSIEKTIGDIVRTMN